MTLREEEQRGLEVDNVDNVFAQPRARVLRAADRVSVYALVRLLNFANCVRMEMTTRGNMRKG